MKMSQNWKNDGKLLRAKELRILVNSDFFSTWETIIMKAILVLGNAFLFW